MLKRLQENWLTGVLLGRNVKSKHTRTCSYKSDEVRNTAKNYLRENELKELNRIVNMWLDFAEDQALRCKQVFLQDWDTKLDQFLSFSEKR